MPRKMRVPGANNLMPLRLQGHRITSPLNFISKIEYNIYKHFGWLTLDGSNVGVKLNNVLVSPVKLL